jgi:hypothetical protein
MNSMIPLLGRQAQINDPLETAGNAASLQNLLQVNQMRQMQMDEIQRKAAEETEMRKRMERVFKDTEDLYWQREEAKRTQNAATDTPTQYPPGSAQSPIQSADPGPFPVQAVSPTATGPGAYRMGQTPPAPVLSVDPAAASGPAMSAPPAQTVSRDYAKMLGDPDFHRLLAGNAHSFSLTKFAEDATKHALELEKARGPKTPLDKLIESGQMPEPVANALRNRAALNEAMGKSPPDGFIWADAQGGTIALKDVQAFILAGKKAGAPKNTMIMKTGDKYGETVATEVAKDDIALKKSADKAPEAIARVAELRKVLREGDVFTGTGAETKLAAAKLFSSLGITINDKTIANTEEFVTGFATNTLDAISTSGLGTGNGFTGKDLEFLREAKGGKITFSRENIENMLRINESVHKAAQKKWAARYKTMPQDARDTLGIEAPEESAPDSGGLTPAEKEELMQLRKELGR